MKNQLLTAALALSVVSIASSASAQSVCTTEAPCVLRIATVATSGTPWADQLDNMKNRFESESGDRIDVRTFLGSTDGEVSLVRQCQDGSLEGAGVSTGAVATIVPQMGVFELPFLFDSAEQADAVIDNELFAPIEELLADNGFQLYVFSENGFRDFATSTGTAIRTGADLAPIQMRSQESWIHEETYRALGGNPVGIPVGEVSTSLSNGNVQGFDNTPLYAQAAGWHSFVDTWTLSHHIYQPAVVFYNKAFSDALPEDLRALIMSNREQETISGRRLIRAVGPALVQNLGAFGITVVELTDDERAAMATATQPVWDMFRDRVDGGGELLDIILSNR